MTDFRAVLFVVLCIGAGWWVYRRLTRGTFQDQVAEHSVKEAANAFDPATPRQQYPRPIGRVVERGPARLESRRLATPRTGEAVTAAEPAGVAQCKANGARLAYPAADVDDESGYNGTTLHFPKGAA